MKSIQYILDSNNNKTHVIIPKDEWAKINNDELNYDGFKEIDTLPHSYLIQHYREILSIIDKSNSLKDETWINLFNEYFKYYNALDEYDISLLYFFRSNRLFVLRDDIEDYVIQLQEMYKITTVEGKPFTIADYLNIRNKIQYSNEFTFLQYFKSNFKIELSNNNVKRIQRIPTRNRLFVYDLIFIHDIVQTPKCLSKFNNFISSKKTIIKFLADKFYNNQETQVYRVYQEATKQIPLI